MATAFSKLRSELDNRLDALPDGEGDRIRERTKAQLDAEIAAHDRSLYEIRKARSLTQQQVAAVLDISQGEVSRIEHQSDLFLSTLQRYLEAIGGRLEIVGAFGGDDDGGEVRVPLAVGELSGREGVGG